jgi:hypothetical protein
MADQWHYTCQGRQMAPVPTAEIQRLAADGSLQASDLVWCAGMASWMPASAVPEVYFEPPVPLDGRHLDRAAAEEMAKDESPSHRSRWDGGGVPNIARRRPRSNRQQQAIVLWAGLLAGGTLLLIVLVLGLLFIALSAL